MLSFLLKAAILVALVFGAFTVKLGDKTLVGHVKAIWSSPQAQDLKQGVEKTAGPAAQRVKRGIEAGYHAMTSDANTAGSASGSATTKPPAK